MRLHPLPFILVALGSTVPVFATQDPPTVTADETATAFEPEPLRIRLYADALAKTRDGGAAATFATGGVDLFATSRPSERVSLLAEVLFEPGDDNTYAIDVERLMAEYTLDEKLTLGLGRYHTSIGYYSTAFHHGAYFQTATRRPSVFEFEDDDGPLPIHGVGAWARGLLNTSSMSLRYVFEVSNGRPGQSDSEAVQNVQDEDKRKAWNAALSVQPRSLPGLQIGVSYYRDRIRSEVGLLGESILAVHTVYRTLGTEVLVEALRLRHHRSLLGTRFDSRAVYAQVSRAAGRFRPFARYEWIDFDDKDPIYARLNNVDGPSIGLRFDPAEAIAFKLQIDRRTEPGSVHRTVATLQTAFAF